MESIGGKKDTASEVCKEAFGGAEPLPCVFVSFLY